MANHVSDLEPSPASGATQPHGDSVLSRNTKPPSTQILIVHHLSTNMSFPLKSHGVEFRNWPGPGEEAAAAFGISHAVILPANARRIIIGGQVGIRDDGTIPSDPTEQIKEAFAHVEQALKAAGLGDNAMDFVYKVDMFEVEMNGQHNGEHILPVFQSVFKNTRPTWTSVTVKGLMDPRLIVEINVEAFLP
ncbi:Endoribonuclease L-PSP/chorismate mutase-like protein [Ilyonectria destructans]|nr:Endoribonuclease L-PSP/chorismate mutase-like protein [Ilyonectria destructans]